VLETSKEAGVVENDFERRDVCAVQVTDENRMLGCVAGKD